MKKTGKILLTDIRADRNRKENIDSFQRLTGTAFTKYAVIKLSLNYFTLAEMLVDTPEDRREELKEYTSRINQALTKVILAGNPVTDELISDITKVREDITRKMKILTAYTDALEIYEYILNRREAYVKGEVDSDIDTMALANEMFGYVFSDSDKLVVNSKIQSLIAQLPVRMTKNRFLDILSNTLSIYKGGEQEAVNDFIETLFNTALIDIPEGFETEYRDLYDIYRSLRETDYKILAIEDYIRLTGLLDQAAGFIQDAVTDYLMLQEIVNDVLILLFTGNIADSSYTDNQYEAASAILKGIIDGNDIYSGDFESYFEELPGAQETCYEELSFLAANIYDLSSTYSDMDSEIKERFSLLAKADMLTSSSLFMDVEREPLKEGNVADEAFISEKKEYLIQKFTELFKNVTMTEQRSIMAKVLSTIPVFFNSQQEIRDYFEYALSRCGDDSELTACERLIHELMEEE